MYQSSNFSLINYFKIDNRSITALFEGEVKYLNLTNYHFSRAFDLFRIIKYAIIIFVFSQLVCFIKTPHNQVKSYGLSIEFHLVVLHLTPKICKKVMKFLIRQSTSRIQLNNPTIPKHSKR